MSVRTEPWRSGKDDLIKLSFLLYILCKMVCMCIVYLGKRGQQDAQGEEGRQCDALGNALLGKNLLRCQFDKFSFT